MMNIDGSRTEKFEIAVSKVISGFELILLHFLEELRSIGRVTQEG